MVQSLKFRILLIVALLLGISGAVVAEDITLRFVVWDGNEGLGAMRKTLAEFEKRNPGIHVKLENADYNTYFQKLLTQYAANVAPDVAMMDPANFQKFAKRGALEPLNPFFSQTLGFDITEYYKPIVDAHSFRGDLFVLPRDIAPIGLIYYNKRAFTEAGIPFPDGTWTWDFKERPELREKDFLWVVRKLTKRSGGKTSQWGFVPAWPGAFLDLLVFSQGARYADRQEAPTKITYDDPRVVAAHKFLADLYLKDKLLPSPTELSSSIQLTASQVFSQGRAAMYQSGIWDAKDIRDVNKYGTPGFFEWDIALAPGFRDGTRAMPTGGSGYAMMSSTPYKKEAWKVIQWMAGEPGMTALAQLGVAQPAIRRLARQAPWLPSDKLPPEARYPPSRILTDTAVPTVVFGPSADYWPEVSGLVTAKTDAIWLGSMTAEQAIKEGQANGQMRLNSIVGQRAMPNFNWTAGVFVVLGGLLAIIGWVYLPESRRKLSFREKRENRASYMFLSPWIVGMLVFTLGPMLLSLLMSMADWDIIQPAKWRGIGNFAEAFVDDPRFWKSFAVTGIYTLFAVPLGIATSLGLALLLNLKFRGIEVFRTFFYMPALASAVAGSLIWRKIFQPDGGLLNTFIYGSTGHGNFLGLGSLLSHVSGSKDAANWLGNEHLALPAFVFMSLWGAGGGMVILLAGLQSIPTYYYESATLDGATSWGRFRAITLPLLSPSLFFVLITGVIGSFQVFTQAFVMTKGGPNDATRFYMYHLYDQAFANLRMGYASALAWCLFAVILLFTLLQFRLNKGVYYEADLR